MGRWLIGFALGACTASPAPQKIIAEPASVLATWGLGGKIWWTGATPQLDLGFAPPPTQDCLVLDPGVLISLNGYLLSVNPGGLVTDPETMKTACEGPGGASHIFSSTQDTPGSPVDVVVSDSTATLHMSLVDPFATRSITLDGGGSLVPGTTATIRWAPATDDLEPAGMSSDIAMDCTPPIWPTPLHTSDGTLTRSGNAFSFQVPSTNQHYTLACTLYVIVYATVSTCDFADCKFELRLPGAYDYPFTMTIN